MSRSGLAGAFAAATIAVAAAAAAGVAPGSVGLPSSVRPGDVFVLRLPAGQPPPQAAVFLGKTYAPLTVRGEKGPVFLIGLDLDTPPGKATILLRGSAGEQELVTLTIGRRLFPEERLTLPPAMVTPPKELEERIAREQALAAEVYRSSGGAKLWDRGFASALGQRAAGNFGRRRILNGIPKSPHAGQDYTAPAGTPVKAVAGGTVRLARDFYYSGLTLFLDHGAGLVSVYMHLEKMLVAEGQDVTAGQVIGRVGSTGRATGPHLHLGVRLQEQRVDPETLWGLFKLRQP